MEYFDRRIIAVIGTAITVIISLIGLIADIPEVSANPVSRFLLFTVLFAGIGYIAFFVYSSWIKSLLEAKRRLDLIKSIIVKFTSNHPNHQLQGQIDLDLINLLVTTKKLQKVSLGINEFRSLQNDSIEIIIDKGHKHGLMDGMMFKLFHAEQLIEIGVSGCTTAFDEATLVFQILPNCPIGIRDITPDRIEIRLIEPEDNSRINHLIANLLYEIDK